MAAEPRPIISAFYDAYQGNPLEMRSPAKSRLRFGTALSFGALIAIGLLAALVVVSAWQGVLAGTFPVATALLVSGMPLMAAAVYRLLVRRLLPTA